MTFNFKSLVLSGCGPKCIGFMGCLHQLQENQIINIHNINTFVGVSSGSMLSYLLIIGYTPHEILQNLVKDKVFNELFSTMNFSNILNGHGIFNYDVINNYIQKLTYDKTGKFTITFKHIREIYNKRLVICSYNETECKSSYFDSANTKYDDVACLVAIRCSSNIPYVFSEFRYKDCEYIDGGICDILPIHVADNKLDDVLALVTNLYTSTIAPSKQNNILKKLINRLQIPIKIILERRLEYASPKVKVIDIPMLNYPIYDFDLDTSKMMDMFNIGMEYANNAPEQWKKTHSKLD